MEIAIFLEGSAWDQQIFYKKILRSNTTSLSWQTDSTQGPHNASCILSGRICNASSRDEFQHGQVACSGVESVLSLSSICE